MYYNNILLQKIQKLLNDEQTVPEFQKDYYTYSLEQVPEDALNKIDSSFFSMVREGLDWTSQNPSEQDRKDGYMNYDEYRKWLKYHCDKFVNNSTEWYTEYNSNNHIFKLQ